MLKTIGEYAQGAANAVGNFFVANEQEIIALAILIPIVYVVLHYLFKWTDKWWKARGDAEIMAQRKAALDQYFADMFGDVLFEAYNADKISRQEYKAACRRFGLKYQLSDLLPKRNHSRAIRATVERNVTRMRNEMAKIKPRIPGPKPGEHVAPPPVPKVRKVFVVAKALRLKQN